jgi:membrane protein required for colicin V production
MVNVIDIILSVVLVFGFIKGFSKGLIIEVSSLVALFLGLLGAIRFSDFTAQTLTDYFEWNPLAIQTISYLLVFVVIVYVLSLLAKGLTKIIRSVSLGLFNKFLGGIFGVLKWGVLMSVALFFVEKLNEWISLVDPQILQNAMLYVPITQLGEFLFSWGSEWSKELPREFI